MGNQLATPNIKNPANYGDTDCPVLHVTLHYTLNYITSHIALYVTLYVMLHCITLHVIFTACHNWFRYSERDRFSTYTGAI